MRYPLIWSFLMPVLLILLAPESTLALWPHVPSKAQPICTAIASQECVGAVSDGAGGVIVAWCDDRSGPRIYVQRVASDGEPCWQEDGLRICQFEADQNEPQIVSDGSGGAIIVWLDSRTGPSYQLRAQRISADGDLLWAKNGALVLDADYQMQFPVSVPGGEGEVIVMWRWEIDNEWGPYYRHRMQRIDRSGNRMWMEQGIDLPGGYDHRPGHVSSDGVGGAIAGYYAQSGGDTYGIWLQRINSDGEALWPWGMVAESGWFIRAWIAPTGDGGCLVGSLRDPYMEPGLNLLGVKRVSPEGTILWWNDVYASKQLSDFPQICSDEALGALFGWSDCRTGDANIYAQRLNSTGQELWSDDGVPVCSNPSAQELVRMVSWNEGGAVLVWKDERNSSADLYAQGMAPSGEAVWAPDGEPVCTGNWAPSEVNVVGAGCPQNTLPAGTILVWTDARNGNEDIFCQKINRLGSLGNLEPTAFLVTDRPDDQGGVVQLNWYGSANDSARESGISTYKIWRLIAEGSSWKLVGKVPASGADFYQVFASTTADSIPEMIPWQTFRVSGVSADGSNVFHSSPVTGYSMDNLAPGAPTGLVAAFAEYSVMLHWDEAPESDFGLYRLYRGTAQEFEPGPENMIAEQNQAGFTDSDGTATSVYKLVAVDIHGNPSPWAMVDLSLTATHQPPALANAIQWASPNPFNPRTTISYTLVDPEPMVLGIYNARGRRLRTLQSGRQTAGHHTAVWDGRDDLGAAVPSGVYFCQLEVGGKRSQIKLTLVR